ncbi:MAG: hydrogenase maturation protease [Bacteroidetes bacterium]|jgi:hydrogenase maturation protease|nr:hydrogenase maturation protease [Bacteroidota bacterium]
MGSTLVIGIGNELRGDDAAGIVAARRLAEVQPEVRLLTVHQLTADMAIGLGDHDIVLFVDADIDATEVDCRPVGPSFDRITYDPHHLTPGHLLAIAQALGEPPPRYAFEVGLPACSFEHGDPLSQVAASGVESMLRRVADLFESASARA